MPPTKGGVRLPKAIVQIDQKPPGICFSKRVAAYARVSSGKDTMLHSLATQIDYYKRMILDNPSWRFAGVFADEAQTGTKDDREQFQKLLALCRSGAVDMVITKSISRLARNTVTLLQTIRELKELNVDVFFEEQNIHTLSTEGELMLTLLASFAQEESRSVSENCKWRIRHGFEEGKPNTCRMLGYRLIDGEITIIPEEAKTVRRIFDLYLKGYGKQKIANILNEEGLVTVNGGTWHPEPIVKILTNEKYSGDLLLQKVYRPDHIQKIDFHNDGQLPSFLVEDDHEAIIDKEVFLRVQTLREGRSIPKGLRQEPSLFSGLVRCGCCEARCRRKKTHGIVKWWCSTFDRKGKQYCPDAKAVPEEALIKAACDVLEADVLDEAFLRERIDHIDVCTDNVLRFFLKDGSKPERQWRDHSRAESWTPEMKETARRKEVLRWQKRK